MPIDRSVVDAQLEQLGDFYKFFTSKEVESLHEVLVENEEIKAITSGLYEGRTWVIVITNLRLVFLDKGMFYGLRQLDMSLHQINSISQKTGLFFGEIEVSTGSEKKVIGSIAKRDVVKVANILSTALHEIQNPRSKKTKPQQIDFCEPGSDLQLKMSNHSIADELERVTELYHIGALTDDEFRECKAKILGTELYQP